MKRAKVLVPAALLMMGFIISGCEKNESVEEQGTNSEEVYNTTAQSMGEPLADTQVLGEMDRGELDQSEIDALKYMRMEELLAHDVYNAFEQQYEYPIFSNISGSEAWHAEVVKFMLEKYDLEDPEANHVEGVFSDPDFQSLYDSLTASGQPSGTDALKVGATIEDLDIYDIQSLIDQEVNNDDIICAFKNLQKGSRNHLRAFTNLLDMSGNSYSPKYISDSLFTEIINSEFENGSVDGGCSLQE